MTTVYSVSHNDGTFYVPTKAAAVRAARQLKRDGDLFVTVVQLQVTDALSKRDLYCALLNNEGFARGQKEVPV